MNETEKKIPGNEDEEVEEYNAPSINVNKDVLKRLEESGKRYPIWNPSKVGEIIGGTIENTEFLEHLNEGNGGYLIRMVDTQKNKFVVFPNKVMTKKLVVLTATGEISELQGKFIYIQYDGEQQPKNAKLKAYKKYTVIED